MFSPMSRHDFIREGAPAASPEDVAERSLRAAIRRGWGKRCPSCGGGRLYTSYLRVRDRCITCGEELHHHRADDAPTWLTILIVGHIVGSAMILVWDLWDPPIWVHWALWPTLTLALTLLLLPRLKGVIVGMQWANRMHGFGKES